MSVVKKVAAPLVALMLLALVPVVAQEGEAPAEPEVVAGVQVIDLPKYGAPVCVESSDGSTYKVRSPLAEDESRNAITAQHNADQSRHHSAGLAGSKVEAEITDSEGTSEWVSATDLPAGIYQVKVSLTNSIHSGGYRDSKGTFIAYPPSLDGVVGTYLVDVTQAPACS